MLEILPVRALKDNYIWVIKNKEYIIIVDPGEADPALNYIKETQLQLLAILVTHHHWDHTNGIPTIIKQYPVPVYGPAQENFACKAIGLHENQSVEVSQIGIRFNVLSVPGHTLGAICYHVNDSVLFSGDTLFSGGCGRVFEGTDEQMYHSLNKIKQLPANTLLYCGHEYTVANLQFAAMVEPDNANIKAQLRTAHMAIQANKATLPSRLDDEFKINPFLRCDIKTVIQAASAYAGKNITSAHEVFAVIRHWKNSL